MIYDRNFGCRFGQPHDLKLIHENQKVKFETCQICNKKFKWNKGYKGRVHNIAYLKAHVRQFAQRHGATKRIFMRLYRPERCKIII